MDFINIKKENSKKRIKFTNLIDIFLRYEIFIIILIIPILSKKDIKYKFRKVEEYSTEIIIKIKGSGYQSILNNDFKSLPNEIYLNSDKIKNVSNILFLENNENIIKMVWNKKITNCKKMFSGLPTVTYINLSNFDLSNVKDMEGMFNNCLSLTSLDLNNINTNRVTDMQYMFSNDIALISLDLSFLETSKVKNMYAIFKDCKSLKSLEISNLDTSSVNNMMYMFYNCESLISLDLSNFDTSQVTYTFEMFYGCSSLIYLNLTSFNTSKVTHMHYMFYGCCSLTSLDLSNFDTSSLIHMYSMFSNCESLTYLNLSKFKTSKVTKMHNLFSNCTSLKSLDLSSFETSNAESMRNMFFNCSSLTSLNLSNFDISKVDSMVNMFRYCRNLEYIYFMNPIELETLNITNIFSGIPENIVYCINKDYVSKILEVLSNKSCYIEDCSNKWEENYINNGKYKSKYSYEDNCIEECPKWTYDDNFICKNCHAKEFFESKCKINTENIEEKEKLTKLIINEIINGTINELLLRVINDKKELLLNDTYEVYQITTLSNQLDNKNSNLSSINLGLCESKLKEEYKINPNEDLIIFKIEYTVKGFQIPIIEYELFSPDGKEILNLSFCEDLSINYYIPVNIDENILFKYNSSSEYYNDRCFPYTTENGTDITLYDRKNEYYNNNMSLCENNCEYKEYNFNTKKVNCECKIKTEMQYASDIFNKSKFFNNFINLKKITNIDIIKCYKLLFTKDGILYNIGSYILLSIIFISIIICILFWIKGFKLLNSKVKEIVKLKFKNDNHINLKIDKSLFKKKSSKIIRNSLTIKEDTKINLPQKKKKIKSLRKKRINTNSLSIFNLNSNSNLDKIKIDENKKNMFSSQHNIHKHNNINNNIILDYNDYELNRLSYEDALKFDKRTFFQYYFSLIKIKKLLFFTFYPNNDYNSKLIKLSLFFFSFSLFYAIDALFFNDSTMNKIYEDNGVFNFIYQIPLILYSTIISSLIRTIITILSLTETKILEIKDEKSFKLSIKKMKNTLKCLTIKFILFFILDFIFLILFWYYLSCFCVVYKNTQVYLIKNTLISFSTSLLYPFGIYIIPVLFRIPSLKAPKKDKEILYKISKLLQMI